MPDPESGKTQVVVRRRRTRRHRRNRLIRRCLAACVFAVFVACTFSLATRYLDLSLVRSRAPLPRRTEQSRNRAATLNQILSHAVEARPVYPYSVVPGGVEDAKELKWVAEHDPVVAAHYAGFDYARAREVRLTLARTVYVSYRIGNHIYWTSHRVTLRKGEKLITDGKMTARARCANRVEEKPQQQAVSPVEPTEHELNQPVGSGQGTAVQAPPVPFQSALLNRPLAPELGVVGPLALYDPFSPGNFVPFSVPSLAEGVCAPVTKKNGKGGTEIEVGGKKKTLVPCGGGSSGVVPEPGAWLLFVSGLAAITWCFRRKVSQAQG